jgi:hypothetical protein
LLAAVDRTICIVILSASEGSHNFARASHQWFE